MEDNKVKITDLNELDKTKISIQLAEYFLTLDFVTSEDQAVSMAKAAINSAEVSQERQDDKQEKNRF